LGPVYDSSAGVLYGVTASNPNVLDSIDPSTGIPTPIAAVGDQTHVLIPDREHAIDPDDRLFAVNGPRAVMATFDVAANRSWYVQTFVSKSSLNQWAWDAGYALGKRDAAVPGTQFSTAILDFGPPKFKGSEYGATGFGRFVSTKTIQQNVIEFASGFFAGTRSDNSSKVTVVVGTNNKAKYGGVTPQHPQAWQQLITDINAALEEDGYASQVNAIGGMDIEPDFSTPAVAKAWVNAYGSPDFVDCGSADGCPPAGANCDNHWAQAKILTVARDSRASTESSECI
jgi:hypothetical protein